MLVKNACWWKTCMLVKNFHQHSPPKLHDVGENNVGEIVCWRKKNSHSKLYVCWWIMLVKILMYVSEKFFCWRHMYYCSKVSPTYRKIFTNIIHQHTFNFLFHQHTASPTYRKFFTNIFHQHHYSLIEQSYQRELLLLIY